MRVIIVAAGSGRRLMPLTKDSPKCLIELANRKIIDYTMDVLNDLNLEDIVMVVGHKSEKIRSYLGNKVKYVENKIYAKTNSMYSLWCARELFNNEFIYLHSDIIFEKDIVKRIINADASISLCVDEKKVDDEDMKVKVVNNNIVNINKGIPIEESKGEFIGIAKACGEGVNELQNALNVLVKDVNNMNAYFEFAVEYLASNGIPINPVYTNNEFYAEIDFKEDLDRVAELITSGKVSLNGK